ncbi:MAG: dTMP kinase [Acidobacteria bacterium]|nr:MAG: dTMP kinase [Acidobacteriota bacterium]
MSHGIFITLEGIDGTGKSTHVRRLAAYLHKRGIATVVTREPGGTKVGEQIRRLLLNPKITHLSALAELTLIYAAREQHLEEVVRPALARGQVVISDRYNDASFAYQGYGRMLGSQKVRALDRIICGRTQPELTLLLDLDPQLALDRARKRNMRKRVRDTRFENHGLKFQKRVRAGYLALARQQPRRIKLIQADQPAAEIEADIRKIVDALLARRHVRVRSNGGARRM